MSENENGNSPDSQKGSALPTAILGFVAGLLLAAIILYVAMIAPRSAEHEEALETIAELEVQLAGIDERDAELQEAAAALETSLDEERSRVSELEEENEGLRNELAEARQSATEKGETAERLEGELAELRVAKEALEAKADETVSGTEEFEAALEEREAELEETREAYRAASQRAERAETERDEVREELERRIAELEEELRNLRDQPRPTEPVVPMVDRHRYLRLLSAFYAARHEAMTAESADEARQARTRAEEIRAIIQDEFPDRSVDRLR